MSNVRLSPVVGTGGIDRVQDTLKKLAVEFGFKGWYVWHADQISRMLDDSSDIKRTYGRSLIKNAHLSRQVRAFAAGSISSPIWRKL